jgi:CoA transferase family III
MGTSVVHSEQVLGRRWAESGAMALTGRAAGPALVAPPEIVARIVELGERAGTDGLAALAERAAHAGLSRQGDRSCGGASRLLPSGDGWAAVTLARDDDVELVPAWLEMEPDVMGDDPWDAVARAFTERSGRALVARGRMLGLPVAMIGSVVAPRRPEYDTDGGAGDLEDLALVAMRFGDRRRFPMAASPRVVDLSSLWAGPLCAQLLGDAGADVIKVEAADRPDGARRGPAGFFDRLHGGHRSVALDLRSSEGIEALARLVRSADVVIEASRPRALAQRGLMAEDILAAGDGPAVWVSITGYGRAAPGRDWVAFGDDAAAAGGLIAWDDTGPCFCADAAADPLSGLVAAAAVQAALADGSGAWLLDVAMADVAAHVAGDAAPSRVPWPTGDGATLPTRGAVDRCAPALGEHTDEVLAMLPSFCDRDVVPQHHIPVTERMRGYGEVGGAGGIDGGEASERGR